MPLCNTSKQVSGYVAGWLRRQPAVKEESLTDWLLDYFDQLSSEIRYYQFSRHEEGAASGADWDWWILLTEGCFKIRVQAKKLRESHDHYRDLARGNTSGYQLDQLMESSARLNFYPIYALYGFSQEVERCQINPRPAPLHICSAQEVYDIVFSGARRRIEAGTLLRLSIPLPCLFCCPLVTKPELLGRPGPTLSPGSLFDHYFRAPPRSNLDESDQQPDEEGERGFEREVPGIIKRLFEAKELEGKSEGILGEYRSMFAGSNGLSIIRPNRKEEG